MKGVITHIQRLSIHDGPGIRSTIFFKGCNFRCSWCHNPETFSPQPELEWISEKCLNCQACVFACSSGALSVQDGLLSFSKDKCTECFACVDFCFPEALKKIGRTVTAEDIYQEIEADLPYMKESDGGITVSGGEPLVQADFAKEILELFHTKGIPTAIETNLSTTWDRIEILLPYLDLALIDLKLMDDELHKHWTKASNTRVLDNIRKLDQTGIPYKLRTPVVPGVNDEEDSLLEIKQFVESLRNVVDYELLPFHSLADGKYKNLGIKNPMEGVSELSKERFEILKGLIKDS